MTTGRPSEAEAEFRKAIALLQKLADDNPAVTEFRYGLADQSATTSACRCRRRASRRRRRPSIRKAMAILQKLADDNPAVIDFRMSTGQQPQQPRWHCWRDGQANGGGGRVPRRSTIIGKVVDDDPKVLFHRRRPRLALTSLGDFLLKLGRLSRGP